MKPILTGSRALEYYNLLEGRIPDDWDFIVEHPKTFFIKNGISFDFIDANDPIEKTNKKIYELGQSGNIVDSPIGEVCVIPLSLLKVMKISSLVINKIKNEHDLNQLTHISLNSEEELILKERIIETKNKLLYKKTFFFDKYKVPRFFLHDDLHYFVSKNPMFLKIQNQLGTDVDEKLFENLNQLDKIKLIWEETFVLSLERFLVPNIRKFPNFIDNFNEKFMKVEKSSDIGIYWLNKICEEGKLKDNPVFIQKWGKENYKELLIGLPDWWSKKMDDLDEEFWIKLLTF